MNARSTWLTLAAMAMTAATVSGAVAADKRTVALVYGIKGDAFYVTMQKGAQAKADELGVELLADGPSQWNPAIQTPIVDAMIARKVDGLIAVPNDPQAMIAVLQRASDQGIPIVTTDQYIGDGDYAGGSVTFPLSYVASDNFGGGKLACELLIESMGGKGVLYVLVSTPNVPSDTARRDGCLAVIEATGGAVELAGVDYTQSNATIATTQTQAALQKNPNIGAIFGGNLFSAQVLGRGQDRQPCRHRQDRQLRCPDAGDRRSPRQSRRHRHRPAAGPDRRHRGAVRRRRDGRQVGRHPAEGRDPVRRHHARQRRQPRGPGRHLQGPVDHTRRVSPPSDEHTKVTVHSAGAPAMPTPRVPGFRLCGCLAGSGRGSSSSR